MTFWSEHIPIFEKYLDKANTGSIHYDLNGRYFAEVLDMQREDERGDSPGNIRLTGLRNIERLFGCYEYTDFHSMIMNEATKDRNIVNDIKYGYTFGLRLPAYIGREKQFCFEYNSHNPALEGRTALAEYLYSMVENKITNLPPEYETVAIVQFENAYIETHFQRFIGFHPYFDIECSYDLYLIIKHTAIDPYLIPISKKENIFEEHITNSISFQEPWWNMTEINIFGLSKYINNS